VALVEHGLFTLGCTESGTEGVALLESRFIKPLAPLCAGWG